MRHTGLGLAIDLSSALHEWGYIILLFMHRFCDPLLYGTCIPWNDARSAFEKAHFHRFVLLSSNRPFRYSYDER